MFLARHLACRAGTRASLIVAALVTTATGAVAQSPRPGPPAKEAADLPENWDTFSVDIAVRRFRVGKDGKTKGADTPATTYRWQREQTRNGWRSRITTLSRTRSTVESLEGKRELDVVSDLVPVRIEDDEDGSPLRFYNARGTEIKLPSRQELKKRGVPDLPAASPAPAAGAERRPRVTGREWAETFVVPKEKSDKRKKGLEQKLGKTRGKVRGFDQFLTPVADGQQEVLADPEFGVPVEMNQTKKGALVSHTKLEYERTGPDRLTRRKMRTEQAVAADDDGGDRVVSEVEFTNLRFERKGGSK